MLLVIKFSAAKPKATSDKFFRCILYLGLTVYLYFFLVFKNTFFYFLNVMKKIMNFNFFILFYEKMVEV